LADVDLRQLAKKVRAKGRGRDTVLAHITPQEAALLKARGGRGSINPDTGLPEFEDDFADYGEGTNTTFGDSGSDVAAPPVQPQAGASPGADVQQPVNPLAGTEPPDPNAPGAVEARQQFDAINPAVAARADAPAPDQNFLQSLLGGLGIGGLGNIGGSDLARLGLAGAGLGMGLQARSAAQQQAQAAQKQIQNIANVDQQRAAALQAQMAGTAGDVAARAAPAQEALQALATPYQQQGSQQAQQALAGALSPMSAQSLQAAQAQAAQAQARSGGVGAAQAANQLEALRQALLSNQYQQGLATQQIGDRYAQSGITTGLAQGNLGSQYSNLAATTGLQASGIADQYTLRAIQAGLAGNQQAQQLSQQYFQALGSILGGTPALRAQPATTTPGA
jgi:hypothetical protein